MNNVVINRTYTLRHRAPTAVFGGVLLWVLPYEGISDPDPDRHTHGETTLSVDRWVPPWSTLRESWHRASGSPDWVSLRLHQDKHR